MSKEVEDKLERHVCTHSNHSNTTEEKRALKNEKKSLPSCIFDVPTLLIE